MIVGIDLAGSEKRDTGFCVITDKLAKVQILNTNEQIIEKITELADLIRIVCIDAPLTLPSGRISLEENNGIHFRQCDLELRKLGIRFFPITLGPMRMLTKRGMFLKEEILKINPKIKVIEVYPGASYDIFKVNRKDEKQIIKWIKSFVEIKDLAYTQDELDGICCAITGKLYLEGKARGIGNDDGKIIIPII
ncbi:MAG: DUF429 domain-containing protein [Candidatus Micrarchaeota archaeon]